MSRPEIRLPEAGTIRQTLHDIEGNTGIFELLSPGYRTAQDARCAVVRSNETRRVYLFVRDDVPDASCWHEDMEIIGFDGLRGCLRRRNRGLPRTRKAAPRQAS